MFCIGFNFWKIGLAGLVLTLAGPASAFAGWMGFRNDTNLTLVVQEVVVVNNVPKPGKPQKMNNGDVIRDTQVGAGGQRQFLIFDSKNPNQPIYTGNFPCPKANENILYAIKLDPKGAVTIDAQKTPVQPPAKKK